MNDTKKLVDSARESLKVAIRAIRDGTNPKATGFDHLNRAQMSAAQISHVQKALDLLDQITNEPTPKPVAVTVDMTLVESIRTTNKALALLLKQPSIDPAINELCLEHDIRVQKLLMANPFAFKAQQPAPTEIDHLFPKPWPYQGFAPCKACHSRITLVIAMHSVSCSDCDAAANTPSEWNELNRAPITLNPVAEEST
ncbi:hypothetical protein [Pseudomonas sp. PLMAX]|uniref:hypothetical protein n=1 Tax=Pseudomonas sp. PLMAX TaxID=2201998 RepID=UPI0038BDA353